MESTGVWVEAVIKKLKSVLPHLPNPLGSDSNDLLVESVDSVLRLSRFEFAAVVNGLCTLLEELYRTHSPVTADDKVILSYCTVLDCLTNCLRAHRQNGLVDEDLHSLQQLFQRTTQLCLLSGNGIRKISVSACKVLYQLSGLHFHGIFNKIILRVTSVNRISFGSVESSTSSTSEACVIQLIPHLNLNAARLQQILQVMVTSFKDLKKHKQMFSTIPEILHKSIWNFITEYPEEFNDLLKNGYPSLGRSAEKLFMLCDEYAEGHKKKGQIWPLQNTLLMLCPNLVSDIIAVDDDKHSPKHKPQAHRTFLAAVLKGLSHGHKLVCEAAAVCGADLFTACTYVSDRSSQIFRYFVTQMQGPLQDLLFSTNSSFLHLASSVAAGIPTFSDLELMVRCLVAQFRLNPRNSHTFSICLNPESPIIFKVALLQAIHIVLSEKNPLAWWPDHDMIYSYAPRLRTVFQNINPHLLQYETSAPALQHDIKLFLQSPSSAANMLGAKSKHDRKQLIEMIVNYQLIRWLIRVYKLDPSLAFNHPNMGKNTCLHDSLKLMTGLVILVQHQSPPHLPLNASEVLLELHKPKNIELWDPSDTMAAFWDISGQVTYSITQKLFSKKTTNPLQLLKWLRTILNYRTEFLNSHPAGDASFSHGAGKISSQLYAMLETVLLLFLRNTDVDAVQIAMSCFKYLVSEAEIVSTPSEPVPFAPNLGAYKKLEETSTALHIGRAAMRKKVWSILRDLVHTPGSALAWEDTYSSWRVSKSLLSSYHPHRHESGQPDVPHRGMGSVIRRVGEFTTTRASTRLPDHLNEDTVQATLLNWNNMTGFLCSLAGVSTKSSTYPLLSLNPNSTNSSPPPAFHTSSSAGTIHSTNTLPFNASAGSLETEGSFISRAKRSNSLHSSRPRSVIAPSRSALAESSRFSSSGESLASSEEPSSNRGTSQTETFIVELIGLLSCDNEEIGVNIREGTKEMISRELSSMVLPCLFRCLQRELGKIVHPDSHLPDIGECNTVLVDQVVSIIQRILDGSLGNLVHVNIDELILALVRYTHSIEESAQSLTIKIKLCSLLQIVMQRSRELSFHQEVQFRNILVEYLTGWVQGEIMFTRDHCTHEENLHSELDLCAMKAVSAVLSGLPLQPRDIHGADMMELKGKLFLKYFTSFMNMVHSLNSLELSKLGQIRKQTATRHISSLRDTTILAMSNMLTANIDSGLTHAIGLGYHKELKTRTSFIEVLSSILKQGAEFNSLADTALADRYNQLLDLVTMETDEGEHPIMIALINAIPFDNMDDLAEVLVVLFDYKNKLPSFLTEILTTEVEALDSGRLDTLFRGNTIACKVLSISFKTFGLYYLQSVLRPLILSLMKSHDCDYEVDPTRISDTSSLKTNQANLLNLVSSFYKTILSSLPSLPLQLRTLCHILYQVVVDRFPDGGLDTVNSAIFLRFINPAIVSPQSYTLIQGEIPTGVRRALTLISKVLQNLANHVLFKKEAHMQVFNEFLNDNFEKSRELALHMASAGPYLEGEALEYIGFLKETYKFRLHSLLWNNQDKMASYAASTRASFSSRPLFHSMNTLLAQMGVPITPKKRSSSLATRTLVSSQLEEFLDSMSTDCNEVTFRQIKAKEVFYQAGHSRAGNPVFILVARKFHGEQLHVSYQLLYHVMLQLKSCTDKAFEIVVDLTHTTQQNEPDLELLVKFAAYVPELFTNQIEAVYFYNCNMAFKAYASKLSSAIRIFSHIKGSKRVVMVDSYSKMTDFIEPQELKLPSSTMEFEQEGKEFPRSHYLVFRQHSHRLSATVSIHSCGLVILLADKQIVFSAPSTIREVFHVSSIREVFIEGKGSLAVRLVDGGQPLKLVNSAADSIVKELNAVISKWHNQQPSRYLTERKLEPKDVPGTFLNLALLNLGGPDPWLRVAAYKLLCAVKETFQLQIDYHLDESHNLCMPMNINQFVLDVSQQLAMKEGHLTLEFISEVVAGFQHYSVASKQRCLAFLSPWVPNLTNYVTRTETSRAEQEKLVKIFDLLVSLTISEEEMYPLIQEHVWAKVASEEDLLRTVLDTFIRASIADGIGSRKMRVLADSAVTLARYHPDIVAADVVKRMLKTLVYTGDRPSACLEQHFLWVELGVLAHFMLTLSFNNHLNVLANLPDIFYICVMMMGQGTLSTRTAIHGIFINTHHSLFTLPQVQANEEVMKSITLKLVEFSQAKFYLQFGLQNTKTSVESAYTSDAPQTSQQYEVVKDTLFSTTTVAVVEHLDETVNTMRELFPESEWHLRWQKLARRSAFFYNPALQSRSFLMLGVISTHASSHVITRTLKVMNETVAQHHDDISLLESIVICLTRLVPLLDLTTCLVHHLFWVAVGVMQFGESTLFAAALGLLEACVKAFTCADLLNTQTLAGIVQGARTVLDETLSFMDKCVGISFENDFNFALAALLFKGFSHPLSNMRTKTQQLLSTLFYTHSPSGRLQVTDNNLPYMTVLFSESEIFREQLRYLQHRKLKTLASVPLMHDDDEITRGRPDSGTILLSATTIHSHKSQILFLYILSCALLNTQDEEKQKIHFLYKFLANASTVYIDVFPVVHLLLVRHMFQTLQQSQSPAVVNAIHQMITTAVGGCQSSLVKPTFIQDIGFGGMLEYFSPFPKSGPIRSLNQVTYFRKHLDALIQEISPAELINKTQSISSLSSIAELAPPPAPLLPRRTSSSAKSSSSRETSPEYRLQSGLMVEEEDEVTAL